MPTDIEIRKLTGQIGELNKTMNRQNAILEKILRWIVLDHEKGSTCGCGSKEGEVPGGGTPDRAAGSGSGSSTSEVQQGAPTPRDVAQEKGWWGPK